MSGEPVDLTATAYVVLYDLAVHVPLVLNNEVQLQRVWGPEQEGQGWLLRRVWIPGKPGNLRVLRTLLMHLRKKLGKDGSIPKYVFAEPRVGYWMPGDGGTTGGVSLWLGYALEMSGDLEKQQ